MSLRSHGKRALAQVGRGVGRDEADRVMAAVGGLHARLSRLNPPASLRASEFKVSSQWNEDGIIQHLVDSIAVPNRTFVEIGVHDYRESNTRFLAQHNSWGGLILDSGREHVDFVRDSQMDWRFGIRAVSQFVTRENVNDLISTSGLKGDIGLLSIDVDGVDYWLFDAIDVVSPRILILEYNAVFGPHASVTVPYRADFTWDKAHWSWVYFGASLKALVQLAESRGYRFLGCESHGVNAFFVRDDVAGDLPAMSVEDGFVDSEFPVARDRDGGLDLWKSRDSKLRDIAALPVLVVPEMREATVGAEVL